LAMCFIFPLRPGRVLQSFSGSEDDDHASSAA
jgi:hypothetical protein